MEAEIRRSGGRRAGMGVMQLSCQNLAPQTYVKSENPQSEFISLIISSIWNLRIWTHDEVSTMFHVNIYLVAPDIQYLVFVPLYISFQRWTTFPPFLVTVNLFYFSNISRSLIIMLT